MRRKKKPQEQSREDVLAAARTVFMEQGFGGASMRSIAAKAGVNEAMLYRFSPSKKELFEEAVAGPLEEAVSRTVERSLITGRQAPGVVEMRQLTKRYVEDMLQAMHEIAPLLNAVLLTDRDTGSDFYRNRVEPSIQKMVQVVDSNLKYWPHRDFDIDFLIRAIIGMCWYLAVDERFRDVDAEAGAERKAAQIVQLIFDGLSLKEP